MRSWIVWGLPSVVGLAAVVLAGVARGQDAGPPGDTDAPDTDAPVELPELERPPKCSQEAVEIDGICVELPAFVPVEGGTVRLGSPDDVPGRDKDEVLREVEVEAFAISAHEVTQGQFQRVVGDNPSAACGAVVGSDLPVACVSWHDAVRFCNALSEELGLTPVYGVEAGIVTWDREADGVRLPTEAEWEHAARVDPGTALAGGDLPAAVSWYADNAQGRAHPVGTLRPTSGGVHDLSGNVAEWVWDGYARDPAAVEAAELDAAPIRVQKGGSFVDRAHRLRVAARDLDRAEVTEPSVGFRVVRPAP